MHVWRDVSDLANLRGPVFFAIGVFDGVHLGHQALIDEAKRDAQRANGTAAVMTFEPHPMMFFPQREAPLRLSSPQYKERLLRDMGLTDLAVLDFDGPRANQSAEDFVASLREICKPLGGICVGADWKFGRGRLGDVSLLRALGAKWGFEVDGIDPVRMPNGEVISSTAIRQAIARGDLDFAAGALGRPHAVSGCVVEGRKLGRSLGFPTANIACEGLQLPPDGVYAASVSLDGFRYPAVANLGSRPTVEECGPCVLEAHLPGFSGDLYGREIELEFGRLLRPERRFDSFDELKAQIARDVAAIL